MSLRSMAVRRAEVENAVAKGDPPAPVQDPMAFRSYLIKLIPAESIALFVLLLGPLADASFEVRWAMLGIVLVLTPAWVFVNYRETATERDARLKVPKLQMATGMVAFTAWTATIPATPWLQVSWFNLEIGAGISLGVAALLALAARMRAVLSQPQVAQVPMAETVQPAVR
jgi:hypothetical protein